MSAAIAAVVALGLAVLGVVSLRPQDVRPVEGESAGASEHVVHAAPTNFEGAD